MKYFLKRGRTPCSWILPRRNIHSKFIWCQKKEKKEEKKRKVKAFWDIREVQRARRTKIDISSFQSMEFSLCRAHTNTNITNICPWHIAKRHHTCRFPEVRSWGGFSLRKWHSRLSFSSLLLPFRRASYFPKYFPSVSMTSSFNVNRSPFGFKWDLVHITPRVIYLPRLLSHSIYLLFSCHSLLVSELWKYISLSFELTWTKFSKMRKMKKFIFSFNYWNCGNF